MPFSKSCLICSHVDCFHWVRIFLRFPSNVGDSFLGVLWKVSWTWCLKRPEIHSFLVFFHLEMQAKMSAVWFTLDPEKESFMPPSWFWWLSQSLLVIISSSVCIFLWHHIHDSMYITWCVWAFYKEISHTGHKTHPNPVWTHLHLLPVPQTLCPHRATFSL